MFWLFFGKALFAFREKQGKFTWIVLGIVLVAILM